MIRLYLDTSDTNGVIKSNNSNPADSVFILGEVVPSQITNLAVWLESASIPNITYTVNEFNNRLVFSENGNSGITFTASIIQGYYDGSGFATAVQTAMNSAGAANTYTVSYSLITKKLLITTILPATFRIRDSSTCLEPLGYNAMTSFAAGKGGDFQVNLVPIRYVDMCVNFNSASIALNRRPNILQRIQFSAAAGSVLFWQASVPVKTVCNAESLRQIEVRLYDDSGRLLSVDQNHQVAYTLILEPLD